MQVFGGTEYMAKGVVTNILPSLPKFANYTCLVLPGAVHPREVLGSSAPIIVWFHNLTTQFEQDVQAMFKDPIFMSRVKYIVVVSEAHKEALVQEIACDPARVIVIPNALEPLTCNTDKFSDVERVKIIHASAAHRGMESLLNLLQYVDEDFELSIFNDFYPDIAEMLTNKQRRLINDGRVMFYGKTPKKTVLKHMEASHIHAYPALYLETFCLTQAESISAGCLPVYTNYGALKEISNNHGLTVELDPDRNTFERAYAERLTEAIRIVKNGDVNLSSIVSEANRVNTQYSWDAAYNNWASFHELL